MLNDSFIFNKAFLNAFFPWTGPAEPFIVKMSTHLARNIDRVFTTDIVLRKVE